MTLLDIRQDDLSGDATRALIAYHQAGMLDDSPPGTSYALDLSGLQTSEITVWSVWKAGDIAGVGALKMLGDGTAELKSMRTHPDHLRQGVAAALLDYIIAEAKRRGLHTLSLETGTGPRFQAAETLYLKRGFRLGDTFGDYRPSPHNQFLHLKL